MFKNYLYVLQKNYFDCGVACLKTIFLQFGKQVDDEKITYDDKKRGMSAFEIIKNSEKFNVTAKGVKIDSLNYLSKVPCIAHIIKDKNLYHYIVVLENNKLKKTLTIMDPSIGIKSISYNEFNDVMTGIFILFDIPKQKLESDKRLIFFLKDILNKNKQSFLLTSFLSISFLVLSFLFNYYLQLLINSYIKNIVIHIFLILCIIFLIKSIISYLKSTLNERLMKTIDKYINEEFFEHLFFLPKCDLNSNEVSDTIDCFNELDNFKSLLTKVFSLIFVDCIIIISFIVISYFFSFFYGLILTILFLLICFISFFCQKKLSYDYISIKESKIKLQGLFLDYLVKIGCIKNLSIENVCFKKCMEQTDEYLLKKYRLGQNSNFYNLSINNCIEMFNLVFIFIFCYFKKGNLGSILFFLNMYYIYSSFLLDLSLKLSIFQIYKSSTVKIIDFLKRKKEIDSKVFKINNINISNLTFKMGDKLLFKDCFLSVNKKDKIIIYGESGVGKTTLMNLILKRFDSYDGEILFDNINQKYINESTINKNITYISQKDELFNGSCLDNLNYFKSSDFEKVMKVCLLNNLNLDSNVNTLSGGEKKKLLLSRALLKNSDILILDEIFSEVDKDEERIILTNIKKCYQNLTLILISHRLDNKDIFDKCYKICHKKIKKEDF